MIQELNCLVCILFIEQNQVILLLFTLIGNFPNNEASAYENMYVCLNTYTSYFFLVNYNEIFNYVLCHTICKYAFV